MKFILCIILLLCCTTVKAGMFDSLLSALGIKSAVKVVTEEPAVSSGAAAVVDAEAQQKILVSVRALLADDRFEKAAEELVVLLDNEPLHQQGNALMGTLLLNNMNRSDMAEAFLYKAVTSSNWTDIISISHLVFSMLRNAKIEGQEQEQEEDPHQLALKVATEALRRNADGNEYYDRLACQDILGQVLAVVYVSRASYSDASSWYFSAAVAGSMRLGSAGNNINVWLKASTLEFPHSNFDVKVAKSTLLEALKYYPNHPVFVYNLGVATQMGEKNEEDVAMAATLYQQAIDLDEEQAKAALEAGKEYTTVIPGAWGRLGSVLFKMKKILEAHECFDRAFKFTPNDYVMLADWAKLLCMPEVGHYEEGTILSARANEVNRDDKSVQEAVRLCNRRQ